MNARDDMGTMRRTRLFSGQGALALRLMLLMVFALYCAFILSFRMPHLQPINHAANIASSVHTQGRSNAAKLSLIHI